RTAAKGSACGGRGRNEAELLQHLQPVKEQVERDVQAVAVAEHVDVVHRGPAAGGGDVAGRAVQGAIVGAGENALLHGDVAGDVHRVDVDVGVGEGVPPAGEELRAGGLPLAAHPARRTVGDIVGEHAGEPVDVMGVEGVRALLEHLAYGHCHRDLLQQVM